MEVSLEEASVDGGEDGFGDPSSSSLDVGCSPSSNNNGRETGDVGEESVQVPCVGMTFRTWEEVEAMYKKYGKANGFGVARTQASFKSNHERRGMTWKCECWGIPNLKHKRLMKKREQEMANGGSSVFELPKVRKRKSKKCDCGAMIYARVNRDEWWEVNRVVLEHTGHDPKPDDARLVKEYRMQSFTSNMRRRLLNDVEVGVPIDQIHSSVARERDGLANMPVTPKDMRHVVDEYRKVKVDGGDARALMRYLGRMRTDQNEFFYSIRVDATGGLQDVFWIDARSKAAYEEFGDVVCFDTTYMTNEFELPFANFVGVNHHSQTTLFGCALMSHEDVETFTWVFQQWLECMGGKAPGGILTDQAAAMRRPIADTMPETTHRWCLWHIMTKIPNKLGGYSKYKKIKKALKAVIYNSFTPEEFERRWHRVTRKYKLRRNEWLSELYVDRHMWVPAYLRDFFWAGMRTTQRVESIHSFFDKFVKSHTRLIEFGEKYIAAIEKRMCQERDADDRDRKWRRDPSTKFAMELHFADLYTDEKFVEVSQQFERVSYGFVCRETEVDHDHIQYVIDDPIWVFKEGCRVDFLTDMRRLYHVMYNVKTSRAVCDCRMFETNGIMCRHIIRVLYQNGVTVPPDMYILTRWKKNVERRHQTIKVAYHDPRRTDEVRRLDRMQSVFDTLSDKACWHEARTRLVIEVLTKLIPEVDLLHDNPPTPAATPNHNATVVDSPWEGNVHVTQTLRDPPKRKKRGRPKGTRVKGVVEANISKSQAKKSKKKQASTNSSTDETIDSTIVKSNSKKNKKKQCNLRSSSDESDGSGDTKSYSETSQNVVNTCASSSSTDEGSDVDKATERNEATISNHDNEINEIHDLGSSPKLPMRSRSRSSRGDTVRRRTKKRLDPYLNSSSDDLSLSF